MVKPFFCRDGITIYNADVISGLSELPDESVQCVVTSPPYWGLRDYGVEGQIGLEPTIEEYVTKMVAVFREVRRVLRKDGTAWVNMGDTYASSGDRRHGGWDRNNKNPDGSARMSRQAGDKWGGATAIGVIKPKDLCGVPWRLAFALQADGWYLRSDIIWHKPNPMPESCEDRPTKSHEYVFLLTKSARYFYDQYAVREEGTYEPGTRRRAFTSPRACAMGRQPSGNEVEGWVTESGYRNLRDVWTIATQAYAGAHFATFPEALVERCLLAGTSEEGCCDECGSPHERVVDKPENPFPGSSHTHASDLECGSTQVHASGIPAGTIMRQRYQAKARDVTTGWRPTCAHDAATVPCTVLDPFGGSGTTADVAQRLGMRCILIELSEPYCRMAAKRFRQRTLLTANWKNEPCQT